MDNFSSNSNAEVRGLLKQFRFFRFLILFAAIVIGAVSCALLRSNVYSFFIVLCVWAVYMWLRDVQFASYRNILKKECNPKKYADFYDGLSKTMKNQSDIRRCFFEVATGLFYIGNAHWTLNYISSHLPESSVYLPDKPSYYSLIANCYFQLNDRQSVEIAKNKIKEILSLNPPPSVVRTVNSSIVSVDLCLALFDNKLDKAKMLIDLIYSSVAAEQGSPVLYQSVAKAYFCGIVALKQGDLSLAREHFDFVIENGNSLYYVNSAKKIIEENFI